MGGWEIRETDGGREAKSVRRLLLHGDELRDFRKATTDVAQKRHLLEWRDHLRVVRRAEPGSEQHLGRTKNIIAQYFLVLRQFAALIFGQNHRPLPIQH